MSQSRRPTQSRRLARYGLSVLVFGFLISASVRGVEPSYEVFQEQGILETLGGIFALSAEASQNDGIPPVAETDALLIALRERDAELTEREAQLRAREDELAVVEAELRRQLEELRAAEDRLSRLVTIADGAAEENVSRLVTIYENMKPEDASELFAEMRPDFAAGFLRRMIPEKAAAILAGLPAEVAYAVSVTLAGHNAQQITR